MVLLDRAKRFLGLEAATQLPSPEQPKVSKGRQTVPSHLRSATPGDSVLQRQDRRLANTNLETYRAGATTRAVMRDFVASNPDLSGAVNAYIRTAITAKYLAVAKNLDGTFNVEATKLAQQLLTRFDLLGDYKDGFCGVGSMRSNSESLAKEILMYGACSLELVLDKSRLPKKLQPLSVTQIEFKSDGDNLVPQQNIGGNIVDLDIPTFFYSAVDQDLLEPYAASPLEAAIQPVLFQTEFLNDLRRIMRRAIHPRLDVEIDSEKFKNTLPPDAEHDGEKQRQYMDDFIGSLQALMDGLKPEDALVHFDTVKMDLLNNGNISLDAEYETLVGIANSKVATGSKVMPSILGHGAGTQNMASAETLLFMKNVEGLVQHKLNEIYSRAMTLAVRLFGYDVYVEFKYEEIDLRPKSELEAFFTMKQERILEQLSLGFISDEQASLGLTGALPPPGFKPLSGTGFHEKKPVDPNANGFTNQSTGGAGGSALNKDIKSDAPKQGKG